MRTAPHGLISHPRGPCARPPPSTRMVWFTHEPGTSKTCGCYGRWHGGLTLAVRTFRCLHGKAAIDRDANGARNNLLAAATALCGWAPQYDGQTNEDGTAVEEFEEEVEDGRAAQVLPDAEQ
jgi:hypothetical protein